MNDKLYDNYFKILRYCVFVFKIIDFSNILKLEN